MKYKYYTITIRRVMKHMVTTLDTITTKQQKLPTARCSPTIERPFGQSDRKKDVTVPAPQRGHVLIPTNMWLFLNQCRFQLKSNQATRHRWGVCRMIIKFPLDSVPLLAVDDVN